jgi:23S rRNA (adenine2503-C2)-methyltransferase
MSLQILSLTSGEYADAMRSLLGKGAEHARWIYQEWFRKGRISASHPGFRNAQRLLQSIWENTSWDFLKAHDSKCDGETQKLVFRTRQGVEVESVVIPMEAGGTLCISSQAGCRMGCSFCETGRLGLLQNLSPQEIVSQAYFARHELKANFRNVVFMGMGEPFDNYDAVMQAFRVLQDPCGLDIGARHITISTSGRVEEMRRLAEERGPTPNLAVSINAPFDELRSRLMPINRRHSLKDLYQAMLYYNRRLGRSILAAYILIGGVNDQLEHAQVLADYLAGLDVKINLIRYNPQSRDRFQPSPLEQIAHFKQHLITRGFQVLVRGVKGDQIMAACGQLGNASLKAAFLPRKGAKEYNGTCKPS